MAVRSGISIDDRQLKRAFENLDRITGVNVGRRVLRKSAAPMRSDARRRAPFRTGALRADIKTSTSGRKGRVSAKVGSKLPYAHLVEFGTKPHFQKRKLKSDKRKRRVLHPGAKAKPFLRPAFDGTRNESVNIAKRELREELRKLGRKV